MSRGWAGRRAARARALRTAVYVLLKLHNDKFPESTVELTDETYTKAPSFFERKKGQHIGSDGVCNAVQAKVFSKGVFQEIQTIRMKITTGNAGAFPKLIKEINFLGEGFIEAVPAVPSWPSSEGPAL